MHEAAASGHIQAGDGLCIAQVPDRRARQGHIGRRRQAARQQQRAVINVGVSCVGVAAGERQTARTHFAQRRARTSNGASKRHALSVGVNLDGLVGRCGQPSRIVALVGPAELQRAPCKADRACAAECPQCVGMPHIERARCQMGRTAKPAVVAADRQHPGATLLQSACATDCVLHRVRIAAVKHQLARRIDGNRAGLRQRSSAGPSAHLQRTFGHRQRTRVRVLATEHQGAAARLGQPCRTGHHPCVAHAHVGVCLEGARACHRHPALRVQREA